MEKSFLPGILNRYDLGDLIHNLTTTLPGALLNSVLLELFHQKTASMRPKDVLQAYAANRFVRPSDVSFFKLVELKNLLLQKAAEAGFEPLQLSPLSPLGTCSVTGPVHQNNIVSATRGAEVVADATNVLALETAFRRKAGNRQTVKLCTTHRHVRAQKFDFKGFTPHFDVFCMTTAGRDTGNYAFELQALTEHLKFYHSWAKAFNNALGFQVSFIAFGEKGAWFIKKHVHPALQDQLPFSVQFDANNESYYKLCRAKISMTIGKKSVELIDCGFTDWTSQLCENRKERFFISGMGVEFAVRMMDEANLI